ncbi:MAG: lysine exporter LysO family protein [Porphyromonas sp.]|nr:lysine exporter LysO family protein [Porphyromonas sp.]
MKDTLLLAGIFALGIIFGRFDLLPIDLAESNITLYLLYMLMFCVGLSVGSDSKMFESFRSLPKRLLFLPILTMIGTILGGALAAAVLVKPLFATLTISAGQGCYTLSGLIVTEELGVTLGMIALLSNVFRELMAILFSNPLARWFGPYAPIAAGGATTMEVPLPFILKSSGQEYLVPSIYHGIVCDLSVPLLTTFFASLV